MGPCSHINCRCWDRPVPRDALTIEDYAQGKRNYDAAAGVRNIQPVPWHTLASDVKQAWARAAHATPPRPKQYAFDVQHADGTWTSILALSMLAVVGRFPDALQVIRKEA
jgi:hypothetical protein